MSDYAAELARKWNLERWQRTTHDAIEGAIREALAKAAEVPAFGLCDESCEGECWACDVRNEIRALGAKP